MLSRFWVSSVSHAHAFSTNTRPAFAAASASSSVTTRTTPVSKSRGRSGTAPPVSSMDELLLFTISLQSCPTSQTPKPGVSHIRLTERARQELAELIQDAWLSRASARRAARWLSAHTLELSLIHISEPTRPY